MKIEEQYNKLGESVTSILGSSLANSDLTLLASNHSFIIDFDIWLDILKDRPEKSIFENAIKEYQISILSNCLGMYQQAFMGLRFFLERSLVAIQFSANEIELNLWKIGERDTYWSELMDDDKGIFSSKFCRAFFPEMKNEISHFQAITKKVYRECSEYVHGNNSVIDKIPNSLEYSKDIFEEWNSKADIIKRIILFTLCLRYLNILKEEEITKVADPLIEEFNSISPIKDIITQ
ncbi:hypothetical protein DFQ11_1282 [Winogradskyella epiphytica]|uniref:Uncharacterized protein n=1 Tax=Winogradskyella epiphytica TaxID=262005 RepID=A0A2V4X425_9FLAO|nr:hypothetical protein [Winogradskyella epiphytica]PYE78621.1 hypothetical protein DFQ11_1282 [Winogradskyella epiphytica]GGW75626.1 hypothetical protein GCM10008085_29240 [Winogradskyella epiphytica]